jgi:hypothetical protein
MPLLLFVKVAPALGWLGYQPDRINLILMANSNLKAPRQVVIGALEGQRYMNTDGRLA